MRSVSRGIRNLVGLLNRLKNIIGAFAGKERSINIAQAGKWTLYFVLIGIIAGLGSVVFHYLCRLGVHFFLDRLLAAGGDLRQLGNCQLAAIGRPHIKIGPV